MSDIRTLNEFATTLIILENKHLKEQLELKDKQIKETEDRLWKTISQLNTKG